jgi:hypothetical protein
MPTWLCVDARADFHVSLYRRTALQTLTKLAAHDCRKAGYVSLYLGLFLSDLRRSRVLV